MRGPDGAFAAVLQDTSVNGVRLVVLRYDAAERHGRQEEERPADERSGFEQREPPSIALAPLDDSIGDGEFRVALEVYFTAADAQLGRLNWVAYVDVETDGVLRLEALVANVTAGVFTRGPITRAAGLAPNSTRAQRSAPPRDTVTRPPGLADRGHAGAGLAR